MLTLAWIMAVGMIGPDDKAREASPATPLRLVPSGAAQKLGRYFPTKAEAAPPTGDGATKLPPDLAEPLSGKFAIASGVQFVLGKNASGADVLVVDTNNNNDLRDDAPATLSTTKYGIEKKFTRSEGVFSVNIGSAGEAHAFRWFRFDPTDPDRSALARTIHYYRDYAREGDVTLAEKPYHIMLADDRNTGSFDSARAGALVNLYIDLDRNNAFDPRTEVYDISQPFAINGQAFEVKEVAPLGASLRIVPSDKVVEELHPPADLRVGGHASSFTGSTPAGKVVKFPEDYRGKLVLLDFWATWCQPCLMEMPNVVNAKKKFGERGFEVLGISLDQKNAEKKIADTTARLEMDWPQLYDGGYWTSRVPQMYQIASIPAAFLVDGETGKIVAMGKEVRGEALMETVERELKDRKK
mgnify:CR=1 FL=1